MATPYKDLSKADQKALRQQFWESLDAQNVETLRSIIDRGFPFKDTVNEGRTALTSAARLGNIGVVQLLLTSGASPNKTDANGKTPLIAAAREGRMEVVALLIQMGAKLDKQDKFGDTALFKAVFGEHLPVVEALLAAGAAVNLPSKDGETPLFRAVSKFPAAVDALLAAGANPNLVHTGLNISPLHMAVQSGESKFEITKKLVDKGADVNAAGVNGHTPITFAIERKWIQGIQYLLEKGANVDILVQYNGGPYTPIGIAIETSEGLDNEITNLLIDKSTNVDVKYGPSELTALIHLAYNNWVDSASKLLDKGADVNAAANNGVTALMEAAIGGRIEMLTLLLERGANINATSTTMKMTALYDAISERKEQAALFLIERGANVNMAVSRGTTPLMRAANLGMSETVSALIRKGANVDAQDVQFGRTALMYAARRNDEITVGILLAEGNAKREILDLNDESAADYADNPELKEILTVVIPDVPWKGRSREDMEMFDTFFEDVLNWSFCPVCLGYVQRSEACRYMHHNCKEFRGGFPHKKLYNLYKTEDGNIYWCTICGRICKGHRHYPFTPHQAEREPNLVPIVRGADFFGADEQCLKDGGGGTPEKVKRFERLVAWAAELQGQVDRIGNREAREQLVEETWNAPGIQMNTAAILAARKFTTSRDVFPAAPSPVVSAAPEGPLPDVKKPADEAALVPEVLETGFDAFEIEDVSPAIRFIHKRPDGSVYRHTDDQLVGKESLTRIIREMAPKFGTDEFGICFEPDCGGKLWPEDIEPFITDPAVFEQYKTNFNKKFAAPQGGGADIPRILLPITDVSCTLDTKPAPEPVPEHKVSKLVQAILDRAPIDGLLDTVNEADNTGVTPLMVAVRLGNSEAVAALLKAGADINAQDMTGSTALMQAAYNNDGLLVNQLLMAGANPKIENSYGQTADMYAKTEGLRESIHPSIPTAVDVKVTPSGTAPATKTVEFEGADVDLEEFVAINEQNAVVVYADKKALGFQRGDLLDAYVDRSAIVYEDVEPSYKLGPMKIPVSQMAVVLGSTHPYWKVEKGSLVPVSAASGGARGKTYRKRKTSRRNKA
jgi:ankyrin repeat protein